MLSNASKGYVAIIIMSLYVVIYTILFHDEYIILLKYIYFGEISTMKSITMHQFEIFKIVINIVGCQLERITANNK